MAKSSDSPEPPSVSLTKREIAALRRFLKAGKTWAMSMSTEEFRLALRLNEKRLVRFVSRYMGVQPDGRHPGHDLIVTELGKATLKHLSPRA